MLAELEIENLAVIAHARIPFSPRLNVFTGETGAGKSILLHGIHAVLGQRVTRDIVRTGCKKAVVTAEAPHGSTDIPQRFPFSGRSAMLLSTSMDSMTTRCCLRRNVICKFWIPSAETILYCRSTRRHFASCSR